MPASSSNSIFQVYGTNTANRVPTAGTLQQRELFVNTYNTYNAQSISIASGGTNYSSDDIGKIANISIQGAQQILPIKVVIEAITNGAISQISLVDYGAFTAIPTITTGNIVVPVSTGTNATALITFYQYPTLETGGGLFVGDATQAGEYVKLVGSVASQDHDLVNITGGNISNTTLANVTIVGNAAAPTAIMGGTIDNAAITGGTITGTTLVDVDIGSAGSPIPDAYITNWHTALRAFPAGVTGVGVLVLGSDGIVYASTDVTCENILVTENLKVNGAISVGSNVNNTTFGSIRAQGDITAFAPN